MINFIEVSRGTTLSGIHYSTTGEYIRLTLGNFNEKSGFKENTSKKDIFYIGKIKPEFILKKGDIITPLTEQTYGLLGATAKIPESNKYIQSQDIGLIKCKEGKLAPSFCYYLISSPMVRKQLSAAAQQTKIRHTSPSKIKDVVVIVPEYSNQIRIGTLLDALTNKIELNNKINSELEQMAKTLYDYWFIQFEFPDGNGGAYKSPMTYNEVLKREIPTGWEVKNVDELCDVITGKEDANFATPDGKYAFFTCGDDILKCDEAVFKGKSILIAGNGNFNVKYYEGEFNAYQRTYVLIPDDDIYIGVMYRAMLDSISRFAKGSNGSIVKFITKGDIANTKVIIPSDKNLLKPLNNILSSIEKNKKQNQKLAEIRDFLLPMLMNGQVSVIQP